ncbi:hypothetical protein CCACVL1_08251 [Corchorus capsularis]|uniref:RNase H type-1 domain-containing protein n=1 Tax=Corchorus capsularis TaxID=210143 RepID=A0A1R3J1J2_COCAP|nr:hypothetical protein CCACVL1_08251 [Corchorus capsularis]
MVEDGWSNNVEGSRMFRFSRKLANTRERLKNWSKAKFRNPKLEIESRLNNIKDIQMQPLKNELKDELIALKKEVDDLWQIEEHFWHQRSRLNWIKYGDRNTHFFHSTTVQRRRQNSILRIKNKEDEWLTDEEDIKRFINESYKDLFKAGTLEDVDEVLDSIDMVVTPEMNEKFSSYSPRGEGFNSFLRWWEMIVATTSSVGSLNATDHSSGEAGLAVVCRNHNGELVDGASLFTHASTMDIVEAMALRLAIRLARDRGWSNVIIETDNKDLARRLNCSGHCHRWDTQAMELDIINFTSHFENVVFFFVY